MRRATQAWIKGPDTGLDPIQHSFGDLRAVDEVPGDLRYRLIHCQIVLPGGNQQVYVREQAGPVHMIVVEQRAARGFANADCLKLVDTGTCAKPLRLKLGVVEQMLDI